MLVAIGVNNSFQYVRFMQMNESYFRFEWLIIKTVTLSIKELILSNAIYLD